MRGTEELRQALAAYLKEKGLPAAAAWPQRDRSAPAGPVAAVSLRSCEGGAPGFQDYLGERFNEETRRWEELYGKRLELTFGVDVYGAAASQVQAGVDLLTEALAGEGLAGLKCVGYSIGETVFRRESGRYVCPVEARFRAWAWAVAEEGGAFLDFMVRGENGK